MPAIRDRKSVSPDGWSDEVPQIKISYDELQFAVGGKWVVAYMYWVFISVESM